jgi:outer membrane receptor protein involved in Fe transport
MTKSQALWRICLLAGAACAPAGAFAQPAATTAPSGGAGATAGGPAGSTLPAQAPQREEEQVEISSPGAASDPSEIVVVGRNIPNPIRSTPQVVSVLSTAEIARSGDGDIAGALTRVTGLSVVGNGFVYVRGLGDRYSSALLNGLPLPSPEPLRRTVPLDIFPTSIVASAVVQKSYSVNYPGEFGGGVINLTTPAVPKESFLNIGLGASVDTFTTGRLGYTYYGGDLDYLGFDDGTRDVPRDLKSAIGTGKALTPGNFTDAQLQGFAASLQNASTTLLQRNGDIPPSFSGDLSFGYVRDVGGSDARFGVFGSASLGNTWRTRDIRQQLANDPTLSSLQRDQKTVITEDRSVVSGLFGMGLDFGKNKIRWTNLYIRDTVKQGRLSAGYNANVGGADPVANPDFFGTPPILEQNTYWFERQLIDTQLVGEFKLGDFSLDVRGGYANSQRESPYERSFAYTYNSAAQDYINQLRNVGGQSAEVAFSDLNEDSYAGSYDIGYKLPTDREIRLSTGYSYSENKRDSSRYVFNYLAANQLPAGVEQERPDYLVSDYNIYTYNIRLVDASGSQGTAAYDALLRVHAAYGQVEAELADGLRVVGGVRYEHGFQRVSPAGTGFDATNLTKEYWLPAGTATWNFASDMQFRLSASKTIARPQFRELAQQVFQDFESDREFQGNPFLVDSELYNAEGRYEYYFGRGEILALAGFYKRIDNPIEQVAFFAGGGQLRTGFANAPKANLYGGEAEVTKFVDLDSLGEFFATRRLRLSANYTYTKSELKVGSGQIVGPDLAPVAASSLYTDGAPLTGQSDHIANLQFGLEDSDKLSQQTFLINYASPRVTNRGPIQGSARQPDIKEKPGFTLDFVAREEQLFYALPIEFKFEVRNITGRKYQEYQQFQDTRVDVNRYKLGRIISLSATAKF